MSGLKKKALNSVKWTTITTIVIGISGPILILANANLLTPSEYAAFAIVTIFINLFKTLEDLGISQAVIQKDKINLIEKSSIFFFNIFFSTIIGILLFINSPFIAKLLNISELAYLLKLTSIIVIISSPTLIFRALLQKEMYFKEISIIDIVRQLLIVFITIILLYMGYGVLGFVIGQIISVTISVILIMVVSRIKKLNKLILFFSFSRVIPFLKFGLFVSGKQVLTFITQNLDQFIIGYFLHREVLGLYSFAKGMLEHLRNLITTSFAKMLLPFLSKLKNDRLKLKNVYNKISLYVALFSFPLFVGISITAHLFVPIIFGEEWEGSVVFFRILSIVLILLVLTAGITTNLLYSIGKPNIVFHIDVVITICYIILLYVFASYGVIAVTLVYSFYIISKTITLQYFANKSLSNTITNYIILFKNPTIISIIMIIMVFIGQVITKGSLMVIYQFIISCIIGIVTYIAGVYIFERETLNEIKQIVFKREVSVKN